MGSRVKTFKDLVVWQKAFQLCLDIYRATREFPANERYGLTAELRKTSRSIPYNIAEGHRRKSTKDFLRFLSVASGSGGELETQLMLAKALMYFRSGDAEVLAALHAEVERMLNGLMRALRRKLT